MIRVCLVILVANFTITAAESNSSVIIVRVYADHNKDTHIVLRDAKEAVVTHTADQVCIGQVKIAAHHRTAGWLILYPNPNSSSTYRFTDIPGSLVIWGNGKIVRTFESAQTLWSWSFIESPLSIVPAPCR